MPEDLFVADLHIEFSVPCFSESMLPVMASDIFEGQKNWCLLTSRNAVRMKSARWKWSNDSSLPMRPCLIQRRCSMDCVFRPLLPEAELRRIPRGPITLPIALRIEVMQFVRL